VTRALVVPAAGSGSRLALPGPKPLAPVAGRAMLDRVLDLYAPWVDETLLVVSPSGRDAIERHCSGRAPEVRLVVQESPTGMLDAILLAADALRRPAPPSVWVTWCDQVAVRPQTVARLAEGCERRPDAALLLPTVERRDPYVHFARDRDGAIAAVLERREGDALPASGESDVGLFALSVRGCFEWLPEFARQAVPGRVTGERSFLRFAAWLRGRAPVVSFPAADPIESLGINTLADLALVEAHLRGA
jgi:bifunctional N-acetylglucosamine-1-phosphate-uridyltransferase/glucosamine-1-phosphate-acetyltransferase GlmU-like protein